MRQIQRLPDDDLISGASCNGLSNVVSQIDTILAQVPGEADGLDWHWLARMKNGKYVYITGSCDYTGWDCQSWMKHWYGSSVEKVLRFVEDGNEKKPIRTQLFHQVTGDQPYGLREP